MLEDPVIHNAGFLSSVFFVPPTPTFLDSPAILYDQRQQQRHPGAQSRDIKIRTTTKHPHVRTPITPVDREEETKRGHGFLPTRQLLHVAEALHGRHGVELHASEVGLLRVVQAEEGVSAQGVLAATREVLFARRGR